MRPTGSVLFICMLLSLLADIAVAQWVQVDFPGGEVYTLLANGTKLFAGAGSGVFLSTDNGASWSATGLNSGQVHVLAISDTNLFAVTTTDQHLFRSTNYGTSWSKADSGLSLIDINALAANSTYLFAGGYEYHTDSGRVFRSTNNGTSWSALNLGIARKPVLALASIGTNVVAGTGSGTIDNGFYLSTNDGTNWTRVGNFRCMYVYGFAVMGTDLLAGTNYGVELSKDGGASWTGLPFTGEEAQALAVSGTNIYAVGIGGHYDVYLSTDKGTSWKAVGPNLSMPLAMAISGTYLVAETQSLTGGGYRLLRRPISEMITLVRTSSRAVPGEYTLAQNYPNPFNPSTTIRYGLPNRSHVTLTVYNTLGQQVALLQNGAQEAGYHEARFDALGPSSGVYFYRIQAGEFVQSRKLVLQR